MKKLMMLMLAACAAIAMTMTTGCKSIEVERRGQEVATVKDADGNNTVVYDKDGKAIILDRGWSVDYFQHWNWQKFDSLAAETKEAKLAINNYEGGADTNLVALVHTSLDGLTKLVVACADAYTKIAGGGAQADVALTSAKKVLEYFSAKGGDVSKATVTTDTAAKLLKVSDGTTCVSCDAAGNCSTCSDPN